MAVEFDHVLAGKRVGSRKEESEGLVNVARFIIKGPEDGVTGGQTVRGGLGRPKDPPCDGRRIRAAQANYPNCPQPGRRGDSDDGVQLRGSGQTAGLLALGGADDQTSVRPVSLAVSHHVGVFSQGKMDYPAFVSG